MNRTLFSYLAPKTKGFLALILAIGFLPLCTSCTKPEISESEVEPPSDYAFYIKDEQVHYVNTKDPSDLEEVRLTCRDPDYYTEDTFVPANTEVTFVPQKQAAVFFDNLNSSYENALYCKYLDRQEDSVFIDDKVNDYTVSKDGSKLLYTKGAPRELFLWDFDSQKGELLDYDIWNYAFSKDGSSLFFIHNGRLYTKVRDKKVTQVAEDINHLYYYNEDMSHLIYSREEAMFNNKKGREEKISDDAFVLKFFDSGKGYFLSEGKNISVKDIIDIDAPVDELRKEIFYYDEPDPGSRWWTVFSLWYFDGTSATKISDRYFWWQFGIIPDEYSSYYIAKDVEQMIFQEIDLDKIKKIPLSQIKNLEDFHYKTAHLAEEFKCFVANEGGVRELPFGVTEENMVLSSDGTKLWLLRNTDLDNPLADLYLSTITQEGISEPKLVASKVRSDSPIFLGNSRPYHFPDESGDAELYFKTNDDATKDVVLNGETIDRISKPAYNTCKYDSSTESLIYFADIDEISLKGTLKLYRDKKSLTISEDVVEAHFMKNGKLLYLTDENDDKIKYELYLYDGGKSSLISKEVQYLSPTCIRY